jgi:uncharacterized membrane protein
MESDRNGGRTAMLVLAYLPLLGLIPLVSRRTDADARWHARNGLLLFGGVVAISIAATVVGIVVPALSCAYGILMFAVLVVYAVIVILAIVKALDGQRLIVPGVSRLASRR